MIFDALPEIAWWALQLTVAAILIAGPLGYPLFRLRQRRLPPPQWRAEVCAAQEYSADRYDRYGRGVYPVRGEIAVRVVRRGDFLTVGTVSTDAEAFEEDLTRLVSAAEERAAALNAHEVILRG
jgi:hypothetical protein